MDTKDKFIATLLIVVGTLNVVTEGMIAGLNFLITKAQPGGEGIIGIVILIIFTIIVVYLAGVATVRMWHK